MEHSPETSPPAPRADVPPKLQLPLTCDPPSAQNPAREAVWIIFGATGHMGRSLVRGVLGHGDKVTAVGQSWVNKAEEMSGWHENCHGMTCDVRIRDTVERVVQESIRHWGRIDVVVNCSGYGVIGSCEDQDDHDLRSQFETNFFGTLNIIQSTLPYFRSRFHSLPSPESPSQSPSSDIDARYPYSRYLIFSSTSGALGVPGLGPYCATKYAIEGLVESMLYEVDPFSIKATLVSPGHVRMDEPSPALRFLTTPPTRFAHFRVKEASAAYSGPTAPAGHAKRMVIWMDERQPVSAVRSAELVWQLAHCRYPPLRLLLGSYAVESVRDRLRCVTEEIEDWKHLNFPSADDDGGKEKQEDKDEDVDMREDGE